MYDSIVKLNLKLRCINMSIFKDEFEKQKRFIIMFYSILGLVMKYIYFYNKNYIIFSNYIHHEHRSISVLLRR